MKYLQMLEMCKHQGQTKILEHISKAMPFIFTIESLLSTDGADYYLDKIPEKADLPFPVCSFEAAEKGIRLRGMDTKEEMVLHCVVAEEISPGKTIYYVRWDFNGEARIDWYHPDDKGERGWAALNQIVVNFLGILSKGQHGHTSPRTVFKWKDGGEKKQVRINKVIHVRPRKDSNKESTGTRSVIWSHAFWVMGHWRTISGIGKNRDGEYGVVGKTWVQSFVKNSELGDPVKKIRLIKNEVSENSEMGQS